VKAEAQLERYILLTEWTPLLISLTVVILGSRPSSRLLQAFSGTQRAAGAWIRASVTSPHFHRMVQALSPYPVPLWERAFPDWLSRLDYCWAGCGGEECASRGRGPYCSRPQAKRAARL